MIAVSDAGAPNKSLEIPHMSNDFLRDWAPKDSFELSAWKPWEWDTTLEHSC